MKQSRIPFFWFAFIWLILNFIQAAFTGLINDEAYYWVYAENLAWGYFDHPPAIAWMIKLGDMIMHNELGLRLFTVILSYLGFVLSWDMVKAYGKSPLLFFLIWMSAPMLTSFGFITVPDAPLLFGIVAFLWIYRKWLDKPTLTNSLLWGLVMAFMLYSKYHGILVIGFTVLSNWSLLRKKHFWLAGLFGFLLFLPHVWWQYSNDFMTFRFHLVERGSAWKALMTWNYVSTQLLILGPLFGFTVLLVKSFWKKGEIWERALYFNLVGTLVFFFLMSFKGWVEANWTLAAVIPIVVLSYRWMIGLDESKRVYKLFSGLLWISVILLQAVRVLFFLPELNHNIPILRETHIDQQPLVDLAEYAEGRPVVFINTYQMPSLYMYYTGGTAVSHASYYYRPSQFNILMPLQDNKQEVIVVGGWQSEIGEVVDSLFYNGRNYFISEQDNYTTFHSLRTHISSIIGQTVELDIEGEVPEFADGAKFYLIEMYANGQMHRTYLEEVQNWKQAKIIIPVFRPETVAISICIGDGQIIPEGNGYFFELQ